MRLLAGASNIDGPLTAMTEIRLRKRMNAPEAHKYARGVQVHEDP